MQRLDEEAEAAVFMVGGWHSGEAGSITEDSPEHAALERRVPSLSGQRHTGEGLLTARMHSGVP